MINAFGFYEQYEGSRGWSWRGVVDPNPSITFVRFQYFQDWRILKI